MKKMIRHALLLGIVAIVAIALPVYAQNPPPPCAPGQNAGDPLCLGNTTVFDLPSGGTSQASQIIISVINILLGLSAVLAVAAIIWGAVRIITSLGNQQGVESGKKIIFWAIVGLMIIGFSFAIIQLIGQALGVVGTP